MKKIDEICDWNCFTLGKVQKKHAVRGWVLVKIEGLMFIPEYEFLKKGIKVSEIVRLIFSLSANL